jgi:hypothetical protein
MNLIPPANCAPPRSLGIDQRTTLPAGVHDGVASFHWQNNCRGLDWRDLVGHWQGIGSRRLAMGRKRRALLYPLARMPVILHFTLVP